MRLCDAASAVLTCCVKLAVDGCGDEMLAHCQSQQPAAQLSATPLPSRHRPHINTTLSSATLYTDEKTNEQQRS